MSEQPPRFMENPSATTPGIRRLTADSKGLEAFADVVAGIKMHEVWMHLAFHEMRQRFRRSILGPFWLTLSMGIMVGALGLVFSSLFQQDMRSTLPHIAVGLIFWGFITSCITEGSAVFVGKEAFIRNVPAPLSLHLFQMLARNSIILGFNMAIYLIIILVFSINPGFSVVYFVAGLALLVINVAWIALVAAVLSTRFRDIPQVIQSAIQVVFFVTPVFWSEATLPNRPAFVSFNPFYHLLEIVRSPLLGETVAIESWVYCSALAALGLCLAAYLYRRAYGRIAYWI